ncbi:MAG TPA: hypothetical protein PKK10_10550 [Woeseiaceae bacterium]|nr:hypothetical protein [Woeseiaceae bacterium]
MLRVIEGGVGGQNGNAGVEQAISNYLQDRFSSDNSPMARLDRWSQQRIVLENLAKLALALESEDPVEHCYQNLIREIDTEAETGIFLATPAANAAQLRRLAGETGVSGRLYQQLPRIAPVLFADELEHSSENLDLVWVSIEARYDRANLDAEVSELILMHLLDAEETAADMSDALRAMLYTFHEDLARRRCDLPCLLNERARGHLVNIITELFERSGDYSSRVTDICTRAGTASVPVIT